MIDVRAIDLIKHHEGLRLTPYKDSEGVLTVGYGHNLERPITEIDAERLLKMDLRAAENDCAGFDWYHALDRVRRAVILNMVFNLGLHRFSKFKKTIGFIENGQFYKAADEMLDSKWAGQVGSRAIVLSNMMRTGDWLPRVGG